VYEASPERRIASLLPKRNQKKTHPLTPASHAARGEPPCSLSCQYLYCCTSTLLAGSPPAASAVSICTFCTSTASKLSTCRSEGGHSAACFAAFLALFALCVLCSRYRLVRSSLLQLCCICVAADACFSSQ
jgi:hypothetical protein